MFVLICILLICMVVNVFAVRGRKGQPGLEKLLDWSYAHRGLHDAQNPENSMAAFRAALQRGYGSELDVHLLKDGTLAVMHDSDLMRTTGQKGTLEDLTLADLQNYPLGGTQETIPTFRQVLDLFAGKAPLIVELKPYGKNADRLTEAACKMLEGYPGEYCIESFDPRCIRYLRKHYPGIIRGQLAENALKREPKSSSWTPDTPRSSCMTRKEACPFPSATICRRSAALKCTFWMRGMCPCANACGQPGPEAAPKTARTKR